MPHFDMFANRLAKMYKHISKWARRQGVTCYRIYDHDVPQFPFAIDKYESYIYVTEYETDYYMDEEDREVWFLRCLSKIAEQTDTMLDKIFVKTRKQLKGKKVYGKQEQEEEDNEAIQTVVQENGLQFKVNLSEHLETGLFLNHRPLREKIRSEAEGKSVLNLFAHTGSFSVCAAAAKANLVVSLDLSNTYLRWTKENMKFNELYDNTKHYFIQDDAAEWLADPPNDLKYDIILMDPPTFSNSKRMLNTLDIQRDHIELINNALDMLSPNGVLYFTCTFRRFKLDIEALAHAKIKDITAQTIPEDFRDKKIHHCYRISH